MKLTDRQKRQIIFAVYLLFVIKVIIFKYPYEQLKVITETWSKEVVLEGLDTANFTLFKTIHMYIDYSYMLNSFENLAGNVVVFIPFGMLLPSIWKRYRNFADILLAGFLFSLSIEIFQLYSARQGASCRRKAAEIDGFHHETEKRALRERCGRKAIRLPWKRASRPRWPRDSPACGCAPSSTL